jgi:hypothetical protein
VAVATAATPLATLRCESLLNAKDIVVVVGRSVVNVERKERAPTVIL